MILKSRRRKREYKMRIKVPINRKRGYKNKETDWNGKQSGKEGSTCYKLAVDYMIIILLISN